ncbi:CRP-like cAMP-binding protein [Saccharopolyspora dendranthemae]|uniref:CRP-like cAMP-binding protein n=1 Tax=Saccharopolyspora dendranthemae TaxID=1181886 RepID=A0A561V8Y8_9PSEU|nr:CRP-like cAMP-binding protein [Saccharopolyspora dendranthemae]
MDLGGTAEDVDTGYLPAQDSFVTHAGTDLCTELRGLGTRTDFDRNELLLLVDRPSDHVLLIERGFVKVQLAGNGRDLIAGLYGKGELIGEQGVMESKPRSATVVAHTACEATRVHHRDFKEFLRRHPELPLILGRIAYERLHRADQRQINLASQDVPTRVCRQLLAWGQALGERTRDGVAISGLSRKDLAQCVGAGEATVDAALKQLGDRGLLRTRRLTFVLPDPHRLRGYLHTRPIT